MYFNYKSAIKKITRKFGFDISSFRNNISLFKTEHIDCVIDVGANTGQFAQKLRKIGYKNQIISIEPLTKAHKLLINESRNDKKWIVHNRSALGSYQHTTKINVSQNLQSSSILDMLDVHLENARDSKYITEENVCVETLDSVFNNYNLSSKKTYLKIDTQGYEMEVLKGGGETLKKIFAVELEMSAIPLYNNSVCYIEIFDFMRNIGFELWDIEPAFRSKKSGRLLQFDCVFVNSRLEI